MPRTRITYGELFADIITDWSGPQPYFAYVVQRRGSADILAMGWCRSEEEATECATETIEHLRAKSASA